MRLFGYVPSGNRAKLILARYWVDDDGTIYKPVALGRQTARGPVTHSQGGEFYKMVVLWDVYYNAIGWLR